VVTFVVAGIRKIMDEIGHPTPLCIDVVRSIACIDFRKNEWAVDLEVSGSQEGFLLPTGFAFVAASRLSLFPD
jgi:alanine-glyoxylate transaminase / serine-glyoxylate transaminase / serine-pyruvate transaminase